MTVETKECSCFSYALLVLKQLIFTYFSKNDFISDQTYFLKNKELLTITKKRGHSFVQQCFSKLCTKLPGKRANRFGTGTREHENLWFLLILLPAHH